MLLKCLELTSRKKKNSMAQFVDIVSRMYFKRSNYATVEELLQEIFKQYEILLKNGYATVCYRSLVDENLYILEFCLTDATVNKVFMMPVFITKEEAYMLEESRKEINAYLEEEEAEQKPKQKKKPGNDSGNNNNYQA